MAREDFNVIGEGFEDEAERGFEFGTGAAFEICSTDASSKEGIAGESDFFFRDIEADAAGGMSRGVERAKLDISDRKFWCYIERMLKGRHIFSGCTEFYAHIRDIFDDELFEWMVGDDGIGQSVFEFFSACHMVDMGVSKEDVIDGGIFIFDGVEQAWNGAAWVDDGGVASCFADEDVGIDAESTDVVSDNLGVCCFEFVFKMKHFDKL